MPIVYTCKLGGINYAWKQAYSLHGKGDSVPLLSLFQFFSPLKSADSYKHNENFVWQVNSENRCQSGMTKDFTEQIAVFGISAGTVGKRRKHHFNPTCILYT